MVRALVDMRVKAGHEVAFMQAWVAAARLAAATAGNVRQALLRDSSDPSHFIISTDWISIDDFRAFERSPAQDAATAPLRQHRVSASMAIFDVTTSFEGQVKSPGPEST